MVSSPANTRRPRRKIRVGLNVVEPNAPNSVGCADCMNKQHAWYETLLGRNTVKTCEAAEPANGSNEPVGETAPADVTEPSVVKNLPHCCWLGPEQYWLYVMV